MKAFCGGQINLNYCQIKLIFLKDSLAYDPSKIPPPHKKKMFIIFPAKRSKKKKSSPQMVIYAADTINHCLALVNKQKKKKDR